jgi:hypothetical protein
MRKRPRFWEQVRDFIGRLRAKRPRKEDDPPAAAGVRSPLLPRTPVLSGGAARKLPPEEQG